MKIHFCKGITVAQKVLKHIKLISKGQEEMFEITIESYCNCREQGFQFIFYPIKDYWATVTFSVAENRNSDSIVVYQTEHSNKQGLDGMSDEDYKTCKGINYFRYDEHEKAAQHILDTGRAVMTAAKLKGK